MEYERFNFNNQMFFAYVRDGKIFSNQNELIGRLETEYQEALKTANEFREILYEHGILTKPKTTEEINKELQETIQQQQALMLEMRNTLEKLSQNAVSTPIQQEVKSDEQTISNESGKTLHLRKPNTPLK